MLIHIRHSDRGELFPDRLMFNFEECSFRQKVEYMNRKIATGSQPLTRHLSRHEKPSRTEAPPLIRIPRGDRVFAQISPGAGDAFCFWIPASSRSELTIVISPLSSLMRDQGISLKMNSEPPATVKHISHTGITLGKIRLLYVAPESLVHRRFIEELTALTEDMPLRALVIDNAHSISEWGGHFRPAYLRIPGIISELEKLAPRLTTLAVTAAPGALVRQNILDRLGLREERPRCDQQLYQSSVSFQLAEVSSPEEKKETYNRLMTQEVPAILKAEGFSAPLPDLFPPYRDPYAGLLGREPASRSGSAPPDILSVTTRHTAALAGMPHVRVYTSLGGDLESWLYQVTRIAKDGQRVHCIRLADLPHEACEADMADRHTRIPACADMRCPFDRAALCDYGKQHHFIGMGYPDVVGETLRVLEILDQLILSHEAGETPVQLPLLSARPREIGLALYRLSVIGVTEQFFLDEVAGRPVFRVYGFVRELTEEAALRGVLAYLRENDISAVHKYGDDATERLRSDSGEIARYGAQYGPEIRERLEAGARAGRILHYDACKALFHQVAACMPLLLRHVRDEIRKMQYRRLWNLKEFFRASTCRYARLLRTVRATDEEWRCQFCDRCMPRLNFGQMRRSPPPEIYGLIELEQRFSEWLENDGVPFDAEAADRFIQEFGDYFYNIEMRAAHILEHSPRNIKALYLTREFSRDHVRSRHALDLMRVARRDLRLLRVIRLCETSQADRQTRQARFDLLDDEYGVLNAPEGEKWLYAEARNLSLPSDTVRTLGSRLVLNALARTDFSPLNTQLNQLLKEFEGGPAIQS